MKCLNLLVVVLIFLGGCVAPGMTPPRETVANYKRAHIIAMEPPPLAVPPGYRSVILGSSSSIQVVRAIGVFNTIAIFLGMPEASRRGGEISQSLQSTLDVEGIWVPTAVLANEAGALLSAYGIQADIAPDIKPIPGVKDRSYTVLMENWLAPIRAWYNETEPVTNYSSFSSDQSLFILEVGVSNYELVLDGLLLQVIIKMIDPSNGLVIGRARASNAWKVPKLYPYEQAFADDARRFKETFSETGQELLKKCLIKLGLVP